MIDSRESAEALRQSLHFDHRLRHKTNQENAKVDRLVPKPMARTHNNALGTMHSTFPFFLASWLPDLFIGFQIHFTFGK
jgi:hypothetical protein